MQQQINEYVENAFYQNFNVAVDIGVVHNIAF